MRTTNFHISCFITLLAALPAFAQPADETASRDRFFPLILDGEGLQTFLVITNVAASANQCWIDTQVQNLFSDSVESGGRGVFFQTPSESQLIQTTVGFTQYFPGVRSLAYGYAKLQCVEPVVARALIILDEPEAPVTLTTSGGSQVATNFQFPVIPRLGSLALVLSNSGDLDTVCAIELQDEEGGRAGGSNFDVLKQSTGIHFVNELFELPDGFEEGTATISCDRELGATGLLLDGPVFTTLPTVIPADKTAKTSHVLPLIADGDGFQSSILITNQSATANQCRLNLQGAGLDVSRFHANDSVSAEGAGATLELTGPDSQLSLISTGEQALAFGYGTLDCDQPVVARSLLTANVSGEVAGMATITSSQAADGFEFPFVPRAGRLALAFTNDSDTAASCGVELDSFQGGSIEAPPVSIPERSTTVRLLDDLFEIPDLFPGGAAKVSCDLEVNAVSLPVSGAIFAALPPVVFSAASLEPDNAPVFDSRSLPIVKFYIIDETIDPLELPEAIGGDAPLTYSFEPEIPGLSFDPDSRRLTGTPTVANFYEVTYRVEDVDGDGYSHFFPILVSEPDTQPSFADVSAPEDQTYTLGTEIEPLQLPEAADGNAPLLYGISGSDSFGPPVPGLNFDPESRQLIGTPSETGVYNLTYFVFDLHGDTDSLEFTITVVVPVTAESLIKADGCTDGSFIDDSENSPELTSDCRALVGFANALIETGLIEESTAIRQWGTGGQVKLGTWEGIGVSQGRVTSIDMNHRDLKGGLPADLGQLSALKSLSLMDNELSGPIPPEFGELSNLENLWLSSNRLSGEVLPELGQLRALENLDLRGNKLTGDIPPELGELSNLQKLILTGNELTGSIPAELSRLNNLTELHLDQNQLNGEIPSELGDLAGLERLNLASNELNGAIPPALGQLANLKELDLTDNQLSGSIPAVLGQLASLIELLLSGNQLSGTIPEELAQLDKLELLYVEVNRLTGVIPWGFWERLTQGSLILQSTGNLISGIGAPPARIRNPSYSSNPASNGNASHHSISYFQGPLMLEWDREGARVEHLTPILGRWAALAVSIEHAVEESPLVITRVLDEQDAVLAESLAESAPPITQETGPGQWRTEYVFDLPGELYQAGNQLVHVIDPDDELAETDETDNVAEPVVLYGEEPPRFRATFIPLQFPGAEALRLEVDPEFLMTGTRALLPIADDFDARIGPVLELDDDPLENPFYDPLLQMLELWNLEADPDEFYHGITNVPIGGVALLAGQVAMSELSVDLIIPHEFGHNLNLEHTPGCFADFADMNYPYPDGQLGTDRGWHASWRRFISMDNGFTDLMSYCGNSKFISDYHYRKASEYWLTYDSGSHSASAGAGDPRRGDRRSPSSPPCTDSQDCENSLATISTESVFTDAETGSIALSGRIDANGIWSLTQAQISERAPRPPAEDGEFTLVLFDSAGVQIHSEPLAIISVSEGDDSFWAARTPLPLRTAREIVIVDPQGAEVLREPLTL